MATTEHYRYDWREGAADLGRKLKSAGSAINDLSVALDDLDGAGVRTTVRSAFDAVDRISETVEALSTRRPPEARLSETNAVGSAIAIGGSEVAVEALDMTVNAMVALASTDDEGDTDFLIGACVDAAIAYQAAAAAVQAAAEADGPAMIDLKRAVEAHGEAATGRPIFDAKPRVLEITARIGTHVGREL